MALPAALPGARRAVWRGVGLAAMAACILAGLVLYFFPWDFMRAPLSRWISEKTGRHFEITRRLDVDLWPDVRLRMEGVELANPGWACRPMLLKADGAEVRLLLLPLLQGRIELPWLHLRRAEIALQVEPDGRRTWALGPAAAEGGAAPRIGVATIDGGILHYQARHQEADIDVDLRSEPAPTAALPVQYGAHGTWRGKPFTARGRMGRWMRLDPSGEGPLPVEIDATAGRMMLKASGTVADLAALQGLDATVDLQGSDLAELYEWIGVDLPPTPPYAVRGRLTRRGAVWQVQNIDGHLDGARLSGDLRYDPARPTARLSGKVASQIATRVEAAGAPGRRHVGGLPSPAASRGGPTRVPGR